MAPSGAAFGVYLPQLRMSFDAIDAKVRAAEELGFHSAWFMDHLATPANPALEVFEGWTLASAVAARTTTIRLGHLVLCNQFRHPALLAKMAATLDVISGGRLELGVGWGSVEAELRSFGIGAEPAADRAARLGETLEILDRLFTGEPVDHEGRFYRLDGAVSRPVPAQAGGIPIHIGGAGPKLTMPLVARYADWWNCPSYGIDRLAELRPLAGAARVSTQHPVGLAPSAAAREEVAATVARRFGGWGGVVTGTPDEVAAALARERALGVDLFILQFHDFAAPETLKLFMEEVAPALT